jgi:hypothetical protein
MVVKMLTVVFWIVMPCTLVTNVSVEHITSIFGVGASQEGKKFTTSIQMSKLWIVFMDGRNYSTAQCKKMKSLTSYGWHHWK